MSKKLLTVLIFPLVCLAISGCVVTKSTYMQKVNEADELNKNLATAQKKNTDLTAENDSLKTQLAKSQAEKNELDKVLNAKSDELSKKIAAVMAENTDLRKSKEEKVMEVSKTYEDMLEKMKTEVAQGEVTITELKGKLTVNMVDAILFDSGESDIKSEGKPVLEKVAEVLKNVKGKNIRVEGHTDNVPITGNLKKKYATNWELSAARATNVARHLQSLGIDPTLLSTAAYGEYKPVAENDTKEGRAKNRRIEIVLVNKE